MADTNTEVYAVVDKSRKKQTLPEDETAESDPPPSIPERSKALDSEYPMTTADTLVTKETEKNSGVAFESTTVAASKCLLPADATYSAITEILRRKVKRLTRMQMTSLLQEIMKDMPFCSIPRQ